MMEDARYHLLKDQENRDDANENTEFPSRQLKRWALGLSWWVWLFPVFLSALGIILLVICLKHFYFLKEEEFIHKRVFYSPLRELAEKEHTLVQFNSSLIISQSIYRGPPTPGLDAAWEEITRPGGVLGITADDVRRLGKDPEIVIKLPKDFGGGYMASVELPHQLHCLNLLRKYTYQDYYGSILGNELSDTSEIIRQHLDHCIEVLRQVLLCNADPGLITWNWVVGRKLPWPDFNTNHICRNGEALLEYQKTNQATRSSKTSEGDIEWVHLTKTVGAVEIPTP